MSARLCAAFAAASFSLLLAAFPATGDTRGAPLGPSTPALPSLVHAAGPVQVRVGAVDRAPLTIAIPPFLGVEDASAAVLDVIGRDLALSNVFQVMDAKSFTGVDLRLEKLDVNARLWRASGADAVIKGEASIREEKIHLELRLYAFAPSTDAASPATLALSRTLDVAPAALRDVLHTFDNDVARALTGLSASFGSRLAYSATVGVGEKGLFAIESDGQGLARLPAASSVAIAPSFGPQNALYYAGGLDDGGYGIFALGHPLAVMHGLGTTFGIAFGPTIGGATKVALVIGRDGASDIYVGDSDGATGVRGLRKLTRGGLNLHPAFGPQGQLAYVSTRSGNAQIYLDGRRITRRGTFNMAPSWCNDPEGVRIVFMGRDGSPWDIFSVSPASPAGIRRLTQGEGSNTYPACSPDGRTVAFFSTRPAQAGLYLMSSKGYNQKPIASVTGESLRWEGN